MFNLVANRCRRYLVSAIFIAAVLTCLPFSGRPVAAGTGFTVGGTRIVADISPGEKLTSQITLSLGTSESPVDVSVRVCEAGQSEEGLYALPDGSPTGPYSARPFIEIDNSYFHLEPGVHHDVTVNISLPADIGDGGRYAVINFSTVAVNRNGVGILAAVNVPVLLTVKNTAVIHKANITGVNTGDIITGKPIDIFTSLYNTGNHHFKVGGTVTVFDPGGIQLDVIHTGMANSPLIPGMSARLKSTFIPDKDLPAGSYTFRSRVLLENGTVLDEAGGSFEIKSRYAPPLALTTGVVVPDSPALLEKDDGSVSIYFPAGAVTGQLDVKLRDYPCSQLPPLPADYQPTAVCFRIDGIDGPLLKPATVKVRYDAGDLALADNNVSRLKLAHWDEAKNRWVIQNTGVDKATMTLSTSTNRFSIWAIVVYPRQLIDMSLELVIFVVVMLITGAAFIPLLKKTPRRRRV